MYSKNKLPSSKAAIRQVETQVEKYLLPVSLFFRIQTTNEKQNYFVYLKQV